MDVAVAITGYSAASLPINYCYSQHIEYNTDGTIAFIPIALGLSGMYVYSLQLNMDILCQWTVIKL